ncbi:MAG TPA: hypothetical protein VFN11_18405, partial [Ktedonobacterales bacterium]|nr:hypothetical protein [Ktedonobacterales bacterium]
GFGAEKVGDFDTRVHRARIYEHAALTLAVAPNGDLYTAVSSPQFGVQRLTVAERANAAAQQRAPVFVRWLAPFEVSDSTLTIDGRGRVWMAVGEAPQLAVLDPATGDVQRFTYAAPSIAGHPLPHPPVGLPTTVPNPGAVWVAPIVAMATDQQGHLWYVRAGSDVIEEVAA